MNDSHTHLDSCGPPNAELVATAAHEGVDRILTVGMDAATNRTALQAAEDFPQVYTAIGRHPNHAAGFDDADLADLHALAAHPRCAAIGDEVEREQQDSLLQEDAVAFQCVTSRPGKLPRPLEIDHPQ